MEKTTEAREAISNIFEENETLRERVKSLEGECRDANGKLNQAEKLLKNFEPFKEILLDTKTKKWTITLSNPDIIRGLRILAQKIYKHIGDDEDQEKATALAVKHCDMIVESALRFVLTDRRRQTQFIESEKLNTSTTNE